MDELTEEYGDWFDSNDIAGRLDDEGKYDAQELLMIDAAVYGGKLLTDQQRAWLRDFCSRWTRQQTLVDRLARVMGLAATSYNGLMVA